MEPADEIITPHEIVELKAAGYVVVPVHQFREYEEAALRALTAAYDPSDPSNLVGMMYPHNGELREITEAAIVDGQVVVRLPAVPQQVTLTIASVSI